MGLWALTGLGRDMIRIDELDLLDQLEFPIPSMLLLAIIRQPYPVVSKIHHCNETWLFKGRDSQWFEDRYPIRQSHHKQVNEHP